MSQAEFIESYTEDTERLLNIVYDDMVDHARDHGFDLTEQELEDIASEFVENGCDL